MPPILLLGTMQIKINKNLVGWRLTSPMHNVYFVQYDVPVSFYDPVSDTISRRGGYRGIFEEEGVDAGAYLGGNHRFRV